MPMEPFLVNPPIRRMSVGRVARPGRSLIAFGLNPRRRKKARTMAQFEKAMRAIGQASSLSGLISPIKRTHRRKNPMKKGVVPPQLRPFLFKKRRKKALRRRRSTIKGVNPMRHRRRRSSRRRNPVVLGNPRRRRSARRSARRRFHRNPVVLGNPRRRHSSHRRYRRNPISIRKLGLPPVSEMLYLGLGAFAGRILVPNVLARVPMLSANPIVRAISRLGIVAVASIAAGKVFKSNGRFLAYGLLANQIPEVVNDVLAMTGAKLSDGNQELELYTTAAALPAAGAPGMGLYTLSDGQEMTF